MIGFPLGKLCLFNFNKTGFRKIIVTTCFAVAVSFIPREAVSWNPGLQYERTVDRRQFLVLSTGHAVKSLLLALQVKFSDTWLFVVKGESHPVLDVQLYISLLRAAA